MPHPVRSPLLAFALSFALLTAARAADGGSIPVELNKLEPSGADCRATMLLTNGSGVRLDSLKLELVVFDAEGIAAKHLAAEFGPLPVGKTVVKAFPVAGVACGSMSRILVNGVLACVGPGGSVADCVDRLAVSSRAAAALIK